MQPTWCWTYTQSNEGQQTVLIWNSRRTLPTCRHQWRSYGTPSRIDDRHRQGREVHKSLLFWDFLASIAIHAIILALLSLLALLQRNNAYNAIMLALPYLLQCNNTCYVIILSLLSLLVSKHWLQCLYCYNAGMAINLSFLSLPIIILCRLSIFPWMNNDNPSTLSFT